MEYPLPLLTSNPHLCRMERPQTRGTSPGQDPKRVAISLVLDTFSGFLMAETDVWLVKRGAVESRVPGFPPLVVVPSLVVGRPGSAWRILSSLGADRTSPSSRHLFA